MKNVEVILPRVVSGSMWFVEYSCYNPKNDRLERFRVYRGFKKLNSDEERERLGKKLIAQLSRKLKGGWRPWDKSQYIYRDETEYRSVSDHFGNQKHNNSHIRKHLSDFLSETKLRVSAKTYESYQSKTRLFCQWLENNGYENCRIFEITNDVEKNSSIILSNPEKLTGLRSKNISRTSTRCLASSKRRNSSKAPDLIQTFS